MLLYYCHYNWYNNNSSFETKDWITLFGIFLTVIFSIASLFVSFKKNKKTNYINSVTSSRIKWIENLRNNISELVGLIKHYTYTLRFVTTMSGKESSELFQRVYILMNTIRLQLNSEGELDNELLLEIEKIMPLTDPKNIADVDEFDKCIENIISKSGDLLKFEWERVKEESKKGVLSDAALKELEVRWQSKKRKK